MNHIYLHRQRLWAVGLMFFSIIAIFTFIPFSEAQPGSTVIASDLTTTPAVNLINYQNVWRNAFTAAGDSFQIMANNFDEPTLGGIPFALLDETLTTNAGDTVGIIDDSSDFAPFFGVVDTVNSDTAGPVQAMWTFDIDGASNLSLNIDVAAMGNFEPDDNYGWTYSVDGALPSPAITAIVDDSGSQQYTLASGSVVPVVDPMTIGGTNLTNNFATYSFPIPETGSTFTLIFTAVTNGGTEAFAFRNIEILGDPSTNIVAFDLVNSANQNLTSYTNAFTGAFLNPGDGSQVYQRGVSPTIPFQLLDDSISGPDNFGIIKSFNEQAFFGVSDTANPDNVNGDVSAEWVFDISSASNLNLSIDMGAMGDFESTDFFRWTYSIDGGSTVTAFESSVNESGTQLYVLEDGTNINLTDPALVDGTPLTNDFASFTTALQSDGNALTLTMEANTNGGDEGFAFQNIVIATSDAPPPPPPPANIVITEIMQNPSAVSDGSGEYFEVYNAGINTVDLDGWTIADNDFDSHLITNGGPLNIAAGEYLVLANNGDSGSNGGFTAAYVYSSLFLSNSADELVLLDTTLVEIDRVEYDNGATFPDPAGASMSLSDPALDNNVGANWCESVDPFGDGDLGTPGAANNCDTPPPPPPVSVFIHDIQGSGSTVAITTPVTVEAIVIGIYQADDQLDGFFIQEEDADIDANVATSEGIFVYCGFNNCGSFPLVAVGDAVHVVGTPSDFFDMSQITASSIQVLNSGNALPSISSITLPVATLNVYEQLEGMLVSFTNTLVVSEYFQLARFGEVVLYGDARPYQFSDNNVPDVAGYAVHNDALARNRIVIDDDDNTQNSALPAGVLYHPQPGGFSTGTQGTNYFRGGDTVSNMTGVLQESFGWRIRPVPEVSPVTFTPVNLRPAAPANVGGNISVASVNVLNYFTSIDGGDCSANPANQCRGADSATELDRQTTKTVAALAAMNADIVGLVEIENNGTAVAALVNALNAAVGAGTYDYINTGIVGTDAITVAVIYKPAVVSPTGVTAILNGAAFTDPLNYGTQRNRPAIAQSFEVTDLANPDSGAVFTVVVNHLKSKGSGGCNGADCDQNDGAAAFNATRTQAASYLVNTWLASDPTGVGDADYLIIGDLNAYASEAPITTIEAAGYADLLEIATGGTGYSYVFDGQIGYLDYALANGSLLSQITGATAWHVNADEVNVFDYNDTIQDVAEASFEAKPSGNNLYEANAFRNSDHDPILIGLDLDAPAPTGSLEITKVVDWNGAIPAPTIFEICVYDAGASLVGCANHEDGDVATYSDLPVGAYTVLETDPGTEWTTTIDPNPVNVVDGQTTSTVVTNTHDAPPPTGSLEITKVVDWNGAIPAPAVFEICVYDADVLVGCANHEDGDVATYSDLPVGAYTVLETDPGAEWTTTIDPNPVNVVDGQTTSTVVTNIHDAPPPTGSLEITKVVDWNGAIPAPAIFEICVYDADVLVGCANHEDGDVATYSDLPVGAYTVLETDPGAEWTTTIDPNPVNVVDGQTTSTVVTNIHDAPPPPTGSLELSKLVNWNGASIDSNQMFEICVSGASLVSPVCESFDFDGGSMTLTDLPAGLYTVDESDPGAEWTVSGEGDYAVVSDTITTATIINLHDAPPPPPGICAVDAYQLWNADTDTMSGLLLNGDAIDLAVVGDVNLNIVAVTNPANVGSVAFTLSGANGYVSNENVAPYALFGDNSGDFNGQHLAVGAYTLVVQVYTEANNDGDLCASDTISFTVVDATPPPPPLPGIEVTGFLLVNADTDTIIGSLTDGMILDADVIGTRNLNIIAEAAGAGSVVFSGSFPRLENVAPFTAAGDSGGDFWHVTIANGSYSVTATAYTEANGNGDAGTAAIINFSMIGN